MNLWRQHSARQSFLWVVVCQSADTEGFLWAANTKVFLWCWLCYFQQKDGARHSVYVFTWQRVSFHLFLLQWRGNCVVDKQWIWSKKLTVCVPTHYLKIGSHTWSWFTHFSCGDILQHQRLFTLNLTIFGVPNVVLVPCLLLLLFFFSLKCRSHSTAAPNFSESAVSLIFKTAATYLVAVCMFVCVCMLCSCPLSTS